MRGTTPLAGVRVLDFTRVLAGPICTRMLADLGAEVIKVEPPEGDVVRFQAPRRNGMPTYFAQQNTGKRCVSIDLSNPAGRDLVLDLAERCDVVVENFRPGVLDRLGVPGGRAPALARPARDGRARGRGARCAALLARTHEHARVRRDARRGLARGGRAGPGGGTRVRVRARSR